MPNPTTVHYRDDAGACHRVVVRRTRNGAWQILDVRVVDTLSGNEESHATALAVAHDYAAQHHHPRPPRREADRVGAAA